MPLCKFHCSCCGEDFELFLRPSEMGAGVKCPQCQAEVREAGPDADQANAAGGGPGKVT